MKNGPKEKLIYVPTIPLDENQPDYLVTINVDPDSADYCKIIHRLNFPNKNDEIHHSGWNSCSSCYNDPSKKRSYLILPCLKSGRVYVCDTSTDPLAPKLHKSVEPEDIKSKVNIGNLHSSHCLANG